MTVPLLDLNAQNGPLESELKQAFERVLRSGQFISGPDVALLEEEMVKFTGAQHAVGLSSGTDALLVALMALDIGPGDEVLCPSFTFFATASSVARLGAVPVFVDSYLDTFNIDMTDAARKTTPRTKAIIPVHLFGQCANMGRVLELATTHKLHVIEDAAQSIGAAYQGRSAGTLGTFGIYSFFPTKNLGALGDAGMLVTNDSRLAEKVRILRNHGMNPRYYHQMIGGNFRLDSLQAAFLRVKLPHYHEYVANRQRNARFYNEELAKLSGCTFSNLPGVSSARIILPVAQEGMVHIWNQFTIRVLGNGMRDKLRAHMASRGIASEIYYPVPLHQQECFRYLNQGGNIPNASTLATQVLSLPIHSELSTNQLRQVVDAISEFLLSSA
jgi:dTDP-4-amino-4,6-dideoxygalactose transaminase